MNFLVTPENITPLNTQLCAHSFPIEYCKLCKEELINKLDLCKDMKCVMKSYIPSIEKFNLYLVEMEDDDECYRTYLSFSEYEIVVSKITIYFLGCDSEFIFGYLSAVEYKYSVNSEIYMNKYNGRVKSWKSVNPSIEGYIMKAWHPDGIYFISYVTTEPKSFTIGWEQGLKISENVSTNSTRNFACTIELSEDTMEDFMTN